MTADREQINREQINDQGHLLDLRQAYSGGIFGWNDHNATDGVVGIAPYNPHDTVSPVDTYQHAALMIHPQTLSQDFVPPCPSLDEIYRPYWEQAAYEQYGQYLMDSEGLAEILASNILDSDIFDLGGSSCAEGILHSERIATSEGSSAIVPCLSHGDHMEIQTSSQHHPPFFTEPTFAASSVGGSSSSEEMLDPEEMFTSQGSSTVVHGDRIETRSSPQHPSPLLCATFVAGSVTGSSGSEEMLDSEKISTSEGSCTIVPLLSHKETQTSSQHPSPFLSKLTPATGSTSPYGYGTVQLTIAPHQYAVSSAGSGNVKTCVPRTGINNPSQILPDKKRGKSSRRTKKRQCSYCDVSVTALRRHVQTKHRGDLHIMPDLFFCNVKGCNRNDEGFSRKDNLNQHLRLVHRQQVEKKGSQK